MINQISKLIGIDINDILFIFQYGSRVYGSFKDQSDYDFIVVSDVKQGNSLFTDDKYNIHLYTMAEFQLSLDNHDISALECIYLESKYVLLNKYEQQLKVDINLGKLRTSISTITSNSWVKGKKKLIILGDYDKYIAIKSIFHSLRILDFGIQIASSGRIVDYTSSNWILDELLKLGETHDFTQLWTAAETKFKKEFDNRKTKFKTLCPKELTDHHKQKDILIRLFKKHHVELHEDLINDILTHL